MFEVLLKIVPEAATGGVLWKKMFLKLHKIHNRTPVPEPHF